MTTRTESMISVPRVGLLPSFYEAAQTCPSGAETYRSLGVDRLVIMADLESPMRWRGRKIREALNAHVSMHGARVRIDFNPSFGESINGFSPCSFERLMRVTEDVYAYVARSVPVIGPVTAATVSRLDLARDFEGVKHRKALMEGLRLIPRARRLSGFSNGHVVWTTNGLTILGKERVELYDRHRLHQEIPDGVLRFEARLGSRWLKKAGIASFADISEERCRAFLKERWDWSQFGSSVIAEEGLLEAVTRTSWGERAKAHFYWSEMKRLHGMETDETDRTRALRRRQRNEVGQAGPLYDAVSVRLDFRHGTEVVHRNDAVARVNSPRATSARLKKENANVH